MKMTELLPLKVHLYALSLAGSLEQKHYLSSSILKAFRSSKSSSWSNGSFLFSCHCVFNGPSRLFSVSRLSKSDIKSSVSCLKLLQYTRKDV